MAKLINLCVAIMVLVTVVHRSQGAANIIDIYKHVVFEYAVMKNPKPVIVFYYSSSSCPACKWSIKPMLEKMVKRKSNSVYFATVDFDKVPQLKIEQGIETIPTTRVYYKGEILDSVEGLSWAQLVPLVNSAAKIVKTKKYY